MPPRLKTKLPEPITLKGIKPVKKVLADGTVRVYLYHRATGVALDQNDLLQSYAAAERKKKPSITATFDDLIRRFETSPEYDALAEDTKRDYDWRIKHVREKWGGVPKETFDHPDDAEEFRRDALEWHGQLAMSSGRRGADSLMACVARILSFNREKSQIKFHPLTRFKRHYKSDRSEMVWSDDLIGKFMKAAPVPMKTAMLLVRNLGQRQKDIRELAWTAYDGATMQVRQSKGRKLIRIKVPRELKNYLDGLPRTGLLILTTMTGRAVQKSRFNRMWRAVADAVGIGELHFHDLRGTAATRLAEAGCTAPEVASVLGWTIKKAQQTIDTYIARSGILAAAAIDKLEAQRTFQERKMETKLETGN